MGIADSIARRARAWFSGPADAASPRFRGRGALGVGAAILLIVLYYGLGGLVTSRIDPNTGLRPDPESLPPGGSVAVAFAARLVDREVQEHGWTPNDSFLAPTVMLDEMPAFQDGLRRAVAAAVPTLAAGPEVAEAAEAFATPSEQWWRLGGSPEARYRDGDAARRLLNARLGRGEVGLDRSPARLAVAVDALADGLDAAAAATERRLRGRPGALDRDLDAQFNSVRGQAYAATMLMRGLRDDFAPVIRARELGATWSEGAEALDALVAIDPWLIGEADLTAQGYYLLLARAKLRALAANLRGAA